jgi:hypothetical protein
VSGQASDKDRDIQELTQQSVDIVEPGNALTNARRTLASSRACALDEIRHRVGSDIPGHRSQSDGVCDKFD